MLTFVVAHNDKVIASAEFGLTQHWGTPFLYATSLFCIQWDTQLQCNRSLSISKKTPRKKTHLTTCLPFTKKQKTNHFTLPTTATSTPMLECIAAKETQGILTTLNNVIHLRIKLIPLSMLIGILQGESQKQAEN